jgi:imidazolonepropionase-like amidohydrolase
LVGALHRGGVDFLAGTDLGRPFIFAGFSLHDELESLVSGGLTPMEALQAATRNPAQFLGLRDLLGTIEAGKLADLVLLDANPLEDIRNTRRIAGVVVNGRWLAQSELQKLLSEAERSAAKASFAGKQQ